MSLSPYDSAALLAQYSCVCGFITRHDYKEVPPHVEYNLTDLGKSFIPVFEHMKQWGEENLGV